MRALGAWMLVVLSLVWLQLDNRVAEGPVLVGIDPTHGVTLSDLASVAGLMAAVALLWHPAPWRRRRVAGAALVFAVGAALHYLISP